MFTPRELALERGWPGRIDGDWVVQLAAQTLEAFFSGGGKAREHNIYPLEDISLRPPVLRPPSIRLFRDASTFEFGSTASIFGPDDEVHAPAPAEARFCVAAVVGGEEQIVGYALVNDWHAPSLSPPKDSDFATSLERLTKSRDPCLADEASVVNLMRKDGDDGEAVGVGRVVGFDRAVDSEGAEAASVSRSQADRRSQGADRNLVRVADRDPLGVPAAGDGLRLGDDLLAQVA